MLLQAEPLTPEAFAAFGHVIQVEGHVPRRINEGTCERFDDLAPVDVLAEGGRPLISIFKAAPRRVWDGPAASYQFEHDFLRFRQIGHCLATIAHGLFGGVVGVVLARKREEPRP